jgi:hypothetical protein
MKKKMIVIYIEDAPAEFVQELCDCMDEWVRKFLPETAYFITNKKLEMIHLKDILPWLKRLVKEAES